MPLGVKVVCHHGDNTYLDFLQNLREFSFARTKKNSSAMPPFCHPCKILSHPFAGRIIFFIFAESIMQLT